MKKMLSAIDQPAPCSNRTDPASMLTSAALVALGAIVAVWIVYPAVVGLVSLVVRRRASTEAYEPFVSVIIATRGDPDTVRARVANCLSANYDRHRLEVIVAVDGYASHCAEIKRAIGGPGVSVIGTGRPAGKATALNAAVAISRGAVLVFADISQQFDAETIRALVAPLANPRIAAVSGMLELPRAAGGAGMIDAYWRYERWLRWREARVHSTVGVTGAVSAMRRSLWTPLPAGLLLDDVYTPMRLILAGYRVALNPGARAIETRAAEPAREYRRKVRTLTGVLQLCVWLPKVLVPGHNPIWPQFIFHKILRLLTPYWLLLVLVWLVVAAFRLATVDLLLVLGIAAAVALLAPGVARRAWRAFGQVAALQAAIVVATANGVRGRWNVWQQ